ncbi:MAG: hypothetical protein Q9182_001804 [Xanthomendoza sp. 2 TL-2023]
MAKSCKKPRAKKATPLKKDTTNKVKKSRIIKATSKTPPNQTCSTPSKHGMTTRANKTEAKKTQTKSEQQTSPCSFSKNKARQVDDAYYTSLSLVFQTKPKTPRTSRKRKSLKTPETPKSSVSVQTPVSTSKQKKTRPLRDFFSTNRSFWDPIKESESNQEPLTMMFADDDLGKIMKRLNNQLGHQMNNKIENYGYLSSSSPSAHDPREQDPVTDEEVAELQLALWPSLQQLVELTKRQPRHSDQKKCYLDQFRALHNHLQSLWHLQSPLRSAPILFQLEPWKGGIVNWRSSTYTNGDDRIPASIVSTHLETWRAETPSPPSYPTLHIPDIDDSDLEMQSLPPSSSDLPTHSSPAALPHHNHRRVMSALYDRNRDIGFLPTAAQLRAYQAGDLSSTTLPINSMSDSGGGIPVDSSSDPFSDFRSTYIPPRTRIPIFESENAGRSDDDDGWVGYTASQGSVTSDKENDVHAMEAVMEAQRREEMAAQSQRGRLESVELVEERRGEAWDRVLGWDWF